MLDESLERFRKGRARDIAGWRIFLLRRYETINRVVAWLTVLILTLTSGVWEVPVYAAVQPVPVFGYVTVPEQLVIPEELGSVEMQYRAPDDRPWIVFIQDAHTVSDAQSKIQRLIAYLQETYGIGLVALEGGRAQLDPLILRTFPDDFVKENVLRRYLERGELKGAEMAAILNPKEAVYHGLEQWDLYEENYLAYLRAYENKDKMLQKLNTLKAQLDKRREGVYSPELNKFHQQVTAFYNNEMHLVKLLRYVRGLIETRSEDFLTKVRAAYPRIAALLDSLSMEETGDDENVALAIRRMAEGFRKKYLSRLNQKQEMEFNSTYQAYQTGHMDSGAFLRFLVDMGKRLGIKARLTPLLKDILRHTRTLSMIRGTILFAELERLLFDIENGLISNEFQREIAQNYRRLRLLRDLASLEWTHDHLEEYQKDPEAYLYLLGEDRAKAYPALEFYRVALKRDQAFHEKLKDLLREKRTNAAVVVAGGFHTRGFERALKKAGYSYAVITPKIQSLEGQEFYSEIMHGHLSYQEFLKSTFYDAFIKHITANFVRKLNKMEFVEKLKFWRDAILRRLAREGRLSEAGDYTRYIDLLFKIYHDRFRTELKSGVNTTEILQAIEEELTRYQGRTLKRIREQFERKVQKIMKGLERLISRHEFRVEKIASLFEEVGSDNSSALAPPSALDSTIPSSPFSFISEVRESPISRSEVREDQGDEEAGGTRDSRDLILKVAGELSDDDSLSLEDLLHAHNSLTAMSDSGKDWDDMSLHLLKSGQRILLKLGKLANAQDQAAALGLAIQQRIERFRNPEGTSKEPPESESSPRSEVRLVSWEPPKFPIFMALLTGGGPASLRAAEEIFRNGPNTAGLEKALYRRFGDGMRRFRDDLTALVRSVAEKVGERWKEGGSVDFVFTQGPGTLDQFVRSRSYETLGSYARIAGGDTSQTIVDIIQGVMAAGLVTGRPMVVEDFIFRGKIAMPSDRASAFLSDSDQMIEVLQAWIASKGRAMDVEGLKRGAVMLDILILPEEGTDKQLQSLLPERVALAYPRNNPMIAKRAHALTKLFLNVPAVAYTENMPLKDSKVASLFGRDDRVLGVLDKRASHTITRRDEFMFMQVDSAFARRAITSVGLIRFLNAAQLARELGKLVNEKGVSLQVLTPQAYNAAIAFAEMLAEYHQATRYTATAA